MDALSESIRAFHERADGVSGEGQPLVGFFGCDIPTAVISACGGQPVEVKAPPLSDAAEGPRVAQVAQLVEPFVNDFATRFLHRFAAGAFDRYALIIFARDDSAALLAYQYALEMRRQGIVRRDGPGLHLWNLAHTDSAAADRFNRAELDTLLKRLGALGLAFDAQRFDAALHQERRQRAALRAIATRADHFVLRMAGYWMAPKAHLDLITSLTAPEGEGPRIGLAGTACDIPVLHEIARAFGAVTADLQPYGDTGDASDAPTDAATLIRQIARNPLHIRSNPADRYGAALLSALETCDLVITSVDQNDNSFGWEIPRLKEQLTAKGVRFLNLGFRPFRPDETWRTETTRKIEEALA